MLSSSSPTRVEIQSLLTDRNLGNKFNIDARKFSRHYESSFFSEEYNFGVNYQGNLVFSPRSYIPRNLVLNLTVDVLGESVNLMEVEIRADGLEYYAESLFGPDGPFNGEHMLGHFQRLVRQFRSASQSSDYWSRVKRIPQIIQNNFYHPRISFGYKVFGNDLKFTMLDGDKEIRTALTNLNPWKKIEQILSGKEILEYRDMALFLDSSFVVPSTVGLPIRLDVVGSAACNIQLSGILDSMKLTSNGELQVNGNIIPRYVKITPMPKLNYNR